MGRFSGKKYEVGRRVNAIRMDAVRIIIIIKRRRTPVIGRVSAGPRKRQDRHPVDSRTPVIGRVSAGPLTLSALTGKSPPTGPKMAIFENAYSGPKLIGDVGYGHMHCESEEILQDFIVRDS